MKSLRDFLYENRGETARLDGATSDRPLYGDFFTYDGTTTAFLSMELRKNFHSFSVLVKINDKMANLNVA